MTHEITQRSDSQAFTLLCSCGWTHREEHRLRRNAKAWARAMKLRAAARRHLAAQQQATTTTATGATP